MKIVFVFDSTYPYYTGGIETWIYNVCERLIEEHEITIFTVENFRKDSSMGAFENINSNIQIIPVRNMKHIPVIRYLVHKHIALYNSNVTVYSMYKEICKYLNEKDTYYLIGLGTVFAAKTIRLVKKKMKNVKGIASCRSLHPEVLGEEYPGTKYMLQKLEKKNLKDMDAIWANGLDTQKALKDKGFESRVIKNGVDFENLDKEKRYDYRELGLEKEIVAVTIGSVSRIKGYYEIIQATKILKEKYNLTIHFVGIGKVDERNKSIFYNYAEKLGVKKQIHLIGEHRDVIRYAKGADIIIGASGGGGYGMALLEAMVSRTPIVAWNTFGYGQLIKDGESAKLVKAWDEEALAEGIHYVINHKDEASKWGEKANQVAKSFDWSYVIKEIEEALGEL